MIKFKYEYKNNYLDECVNLTAIIKEKLTVPIGELSLFDCKSKLDPKNTTQNSNLYLVSKSMEFYIHTQETAINIYTMNAEYGRILMHNKYEAHKA